MTERQRRFCERYIECKDAGRAAAEAGYRTAGYGDVILKQPDVRSFIDKALPGVSGERIASADDILSFLTAVMRGELSDLVASKKDGVVYFTSRPPTLRERLSAAALIGRRYGMFSERSAFPDITDAVIFEDGVPD